MLDKGKFMEMLEAITQVAKVQENYITKEEIEEYFRDMELEEGHYQHIYQYLGENGIKVAGFIHKEFPKEIEKESSKEVDTEKKGEESQVLSFYMEELDNISQISEKEQTTLFIQLRNGEERAKERLLEGYLPIVVEIANAYKGKGISVEDLIQEGNLGLWEGLEQVTTIANIEDGDSFLREHIKMAIVTVIDEENDETDWETTMVAKTGLISEAAKVLAEDMGRVATIKELAEYTKISEEEVKDILSLSLDAVKVGEENGK